MKFAVAFAAFLAVAVASPYLKPIDSSMDELGAIIAAIQSPSTDPATAALLEQQLADLLGDLVIKPEPALVDEASPIAIGPTLIDFPLPDGGALTPGLLPIETPAVVESPVAPAPAVVAESAVSPLVQIIVNVNQAEAVAPSPVSPAPVETPVAVAPVQVVDEAVNVDTIVPTPVQVVDVAPEPVEVVETPVAVEPIQIGTPIIPIPVITLPDELN